MKAASFPRSRLATGACLLAGACLTLLLLASPASAVTIAVKPDVFVNATVTSSITASEPAGVAALLVDGAAVATARIEPAQPAAFAPVPLSSGLHDLRVLVRSRDGVTASPVALVHSWWRPAAPRTSGLRPTFSPKSVTLPMVPDSNTRTLSVLVNGTQVWSRSISAGVKVTPSASLRSGVNTVVLRAANPVTYSSTTLKLTRPLWPAPGHTTYTSYFGWRVHPILGTRRFHAGVDIRAPSGASIVAAAPGTVVLAAPYGGYGNCVMIDHGSGVVTLYGHQSRIGVRKGQVVRAGQTIGYVGMTGLATGPHLHFEVRVNGSPVDPRAYL